ncbi:ATP-binding protein [uncultured Aquimarina sp.]|uniref:tetratricopeptide repeat-containing sensor histidine kinase n=1 Tax=uncultured Aquimarina sp. TaxID=575652 RepID=UPI00260D96FF|nr:ATP-binding protein [uncultured Aquimarina sp.]
MTPYRLLPLLFVFLVTLTMYSQTKKEYCEEWQNKTDSISDLNKGILNDKFYLPKVDDKCKIRIYINLGSIYLNKVKMDSALYYMDTAIALGQKIQADEELVFAYTEKTNILISLNRYFEVEDLLKESRKLLEKNPESKSWLYYYDKKGYMKYVKSEYYKALAYMDSTIIISKQRGLTKEIHQTYEHKGVLYMRLSEYERAAENFFKSLEYKQENNLIRDLSSTYRYLGSCFFKLKQYETAKKYIVKALEFGKSNNNNFAMMISYKHLATYNRFMNLNQEAEIAVDEAIRLAKESKTDNHIAAGLEEKGWLYFNNYNDYDQAEKYFEEAYQFSKKTKQDENIYYSIQALIGVYIKKKNATKIKELINELEPIVKKVSKPDYRMYIEKIYGQYYEIVNNPKRALSHFKVYHNLKDSITNVEVSTKVVSLEKKYDTKDKELKIVTLNKQKEEQQQIAKQAKAQQNLYLLATGFLLFLLGTGAWAFRKLRKQQKELVSINQVKNRLFSIIAHDLRGMIIPFQRSGKILKYHIDKGNHEKTIELSQELEQNSESLSNMLDNLLNWSLEQMSGYKINLQAISISEELNEIISGYEQQAAYKKTKIDLKYKEDLWVNLDKGAFHVIFRNLIGNALKYTEEGNIRIEFTSEDDMFLCSITDTGVGMSQDQLKNLFTLEEKKSTIGTQGEKGTGLGLNLVYRFIKMHKGTIQVSSEKRIGTRFDLNIPITKYQFNEKTERKPLSA